MQFNANEFIEIALRLNLLLGDEHDRLADLAQEVAKIKLMWLDSQDKKNVSEAMLKVEADPKYLEYKKQELKVKRIEEFIKVCKKMSSVANGGY